MVKQKIKLQQRYHKERRTILIILRVQLLFFINQTITNKDYHTVTLIKGKSHFNLQIQFTKKCISGLVNINCIQNMLFLRITNSFYPIRSFQ